MWKQSMLQALQPLRGSPPQAATSLRAGLRSPPVKRFHSTKPPKPSPPPAQRAAGPVAAAQASKQLSRADRILGRLPPSMQRYTSRLRSAPLSHVVAFLVLHEITAVVPLLGLFALFHYAASAAPIGYMMEHYGGYVREGTAKFERYFTRKGWFGFGQQAGEGADKVLAGEDRGDDADAAVMSRWEGPDDKYRIVVEVALAYSITKVLLPARIVFSLWATPWFAGFMGRMRRVLPWAKAQK